MNEDSMETTREIDVFDLNYEVHGEKWLNILNDELRLRIPDLNGWGVGGVQASEAFKFSYQKFVVNTMEGTNSVPAQIPHLKIVTGTTNSGTKALYLVLGWDREIDDQSFNIWSESVNEAISKVDLDDPEFEWSAVIGQIASMNQSYFGLSSSVEIGDISLKPGGTSYIFHNTSDPPYFGSISPSKNWPIIIQGVSRGFEWPAASGRAAEQTHRVAAMLSIAWNATFVLLHSATPTRDIRIPSSDRQDGFTPHLPFERKRKKVPSWLVEHWNILDDDKYLRDAVNVYYEGLLLYNTHPSFAYVAFTAVIETIGKKILNGRGGAVEKFQAGLSAAKLKPGKRQELEDLYNSRRSETVHAGGLHGGENRLGSVHFPSIFVPDTTGTFKYTDLWLIQLASRKLLVRALKGLLD